MCHNSNNAQSSCVASVRDVTVTVGKVGLIAQNGHSSAEL